METSPCQTTTQQMSVDDAPPRRPLDSLHPVRPLLHSFLSDEDGARLLRVSRSIARNLLPGFTFHQHVFVGESEQQMFRLQALYEAYDMRPMRMYLSFELRILSLEEGTDRSPFPSSLTSLVLAPPIRALHRSDPLMFDADAERCEEIDCPWIRMMRNRSDESYEQMFRYIGSVPVQAFMYVNGLFRSPLPPGLLPHGLRRLQLPDAWDLALEPGSIPSTVVTLQLGIFNQPLLGGMFPLCPLLPSSLLQLHTFGFTLPLLPGVLPPTLQRLCMTRWNQPLQLGVLPASLRALQVDAFNHPLLPGALPAGLTHLALLQFSHPLNVGILPSSLINLDLGWRFDHPLLPGQQLLTWPPSHAVDASYSPWFPSSSPMALHG